MLPALVLVVHPADRSRGSGGSGGAGTTAGAAAGGPGPGSRALGADAPGGGSKWCSLVCFPSAVCPLPALALLSASGHLWAVMAPCPASPLLRPASMSLLMHDVGVETTAVDGPWVTTGRCVSRVCLPLAHLLHVTGSVTRNWFAWCMCGSPVIAFSALVLVPL